MNKKYVIQISKYQAYPFDLIKQGHKHFTYQIKTKFPIQIPYTLKYYQKKFLKISELQLLSASIIKILQISEQRSFNQFTLRFQLVSFSLQQAFNMKLELTNLQKKMMAICELLLTNRIIPVYDSKCFGLSQNSQVKYYLLPDYRQIYSQSQFRQEIKHLPANIKKIIRQIKLSQCITPRDTIDEDKTSLRISQRDLSAYNKKFQQKISLIQSKLLLNKYGSTDKLNSSQKLKRRKKLSQNFTQQSISVSSSQSSSFKKTQNKVKIYMQKNRQSYKNQRENQYAKTQKESFYKPSRQNSKQSSEQQQNQNSQNNRVMKSSKLTNSLIIQQKNDQTQNFKHHKSSFGDYSNYDSQKQQKLKRRISFALQKSKYALNLYQKYQSMKNKSLKKQ